MDIIASEIYRYCDIYHEEKDNHVITDDYFYFMYPYSMFVKNKIENIFDEYSQFCFKDVNYLIDDIVFQIVGFAKPQLFNYIILYEYEISVEEKILEGDTREEKLSWFIKEMSNTKEWIEYCFEKYPLFLKVLSNFTNNIIQYVADIVGSYCEDFNDLHILGVDSASLLKKITLFAGDLHNGKCVVFFEFKNDVKLVFKPRSAKNEIAFLEICSLLKSEGCQFEVGIPAFLNKDTHTWYDFVKIKEITSIDDLPAYYKNLGNILCVFFILGTQDIIPDNVISTGGVPYIIDLEILMSKPKSFTIYPEINYHFESSVIKTGMLPTWMLNGINERNNISSLFFPYKNNDQLFCNHLPCSNGKHYSMTPKLLEDFICGFKEMYNFFGHNRIAIFDKINGLSSLKCCVNRIILHPTSFYSMLFNEMTIPECLNGNLTLESLLKNVVKPAFYKNLGNTEILIKSIINQLLNCDIPYFFVKEAENALYDAYGTVVLDDFQFNNMVGCMRIQEQLRVLSEEDLNLQLSIIKSTNTLAFEYFGLDSENDQNTVDFNIVNPVKNDYLRTSVLIGNKLYDTKIQIGKEINWVGKNRSELDGRYETMPMNQNLYDGNIGIALFFVYLSKYTNCEKYIELSLNIFENVKKNFYELENIGYYDDMIIQLKKYQSISPLGFPMSLLYLMDHLPSTYYDEKIKTDVLFQISKFLPITDNYDYFSGLVGLIDYLITDKKGKKNWKYHEMLEESTMSLINKAIKDKNIIKWIYKDPFDNFREMELGGFAHGSSANAYIFNKLFEDNGNEKYLHFTHMSLNHDRSFFSKSINGWRDGRVLEEVYDGGSWCHGASGIALSRLLLVNSKVQDKQIDEELIIASSIIKKTIGFNQCVCHGDMGNLEILFAIGKYLGNKEHVNYSLIQANKISDQINSGKLITCGDDKIEQLNGLYMGVAGVGYQFLRLLDWENVPSILCLENREKYNKILH